MNKKILLIDDLRSFRSHPDKSDLYVARNSDEAISLLNAYGSFDSVFWDHDLGGDDTTMVVANWLFKEAVAGNRKINLGTCFIHTSNPAGADHLRTTLESRFLNYTCVRIGQDDSRNIFSVPE